VATELDAFDYALPAERIAQTPCEPRDAARLLHLDRASGVRTPHRVSDLPRLLRSGDLLVVNTTRVLPARLRGHKASGGAAEALVLGRAGAAPRHGRTSWRALLRCRGRLRPGLKLVLGGLDAEVAALGEGGEVELAFPAGADPYRGGEAPLPPYIRREAPRPEDRERYQTVFAREPGSVAAPTAGLHFTPALLEALAETGVERAEVVLHVGPGTFRPLSARDLARGELHAEPFELPEETAAAVARTRARGGRVVAVGSTATRVLESRARPDRGVEPGRGETRLFLRPRRPAHPSDPECDAPRPFGVVDALLTNFHLPRSSLLLLVAAFAGRRAVLDAYAEAVREGYRFYSYGDAMLIT
jgi:S-adenosylmethionine:tRNA ribosyltransferase-isomerase